VDRTVDPEMERRPNSIELFAGAGGLALGLEMAGFSTAALIENDEYCCETLRCNAPKYFPNASIFQRDITKFDDNINAWHLFGFHATYCQRREYFAE